MRIHELFEETQSEPEQKMPHLYLDMDGVQADFFGAWAQKHGVSTYKEIPRREDDIQALATSSGVPPRRRGIPLIHSFLTSSGNLAVISVIINPGAMALQRMFREPSSKATDLVKPIIPAFEAA